MKKPPEKYRIIIGPLATLPSDGNNGHFRIPQGMKHIWYDCIISDQEGWDHVSVRVINLASGFQRTPYWSEMCIVKDIFFEKHEVVMQLHPAESDYVNDHPNVLHLWLPHSQEIPKPPKIMV